MTIASSSRSHPRETSSSEERPSKRSKIKPLLTLGKKDNISFDVRPDSKFSFRTGEILNILPHFSKGLTAIIQIGINPFLSLHPNETPFLTIENNIEKIFEIPMDLKPSITLQKAGAKFLEATTQDGSVKLQIPESRFYTDEQTQTANSVFSETSLILKDATDLTLKTDVKKQVILETKTDIYLKFPKKTGVKITPQKDCSPFSGIQSQEALELSVKTNSEDISLPLERLPYFKLPKDIQDAELKTTKDLEFTIYLQAEQFVTSQHNTLIQTPPTEQAEASSCPPQDLTQGTLNSSVEANDGRQAETQNTYTGIDLLLEVATQENLTERSEASSLPQFSRESSKNTSQNLSHASSASYLPSRDLEQASSDSKVPMGQLKGKKKMGQLKGKKKKALDAISQLDPSLAIQTQSTERPQIPSLTTQNTSSTFPTFELENKKNYPKNMQSIEQWAQIIPNVRNKHDIFFNFKFSTSVLHQSYLKNELSKKNFHPLSYKNTIKAYIAFMIKQKLVQKLPISAIPNILENIVYDDELKTKIKEMKETLEIKYEPLHQGKKIKLSPDGKTELIIHKISSQEAPQLMFPLDKIGFAFHESYDEHVKECDKHRGKKLSYILNEVLAKNKGTKRKK